MIVYKETPEFLRDLKKLLKKFPTLKDDLEINKKYRLELFHLQKIDNKSIFIINGVGNCESFQFFKVKKFQSKSLKGRGANSGIRLIYAYLPVENLIVLIEIYFKANSENEDRKRIENFKNNKQ